MSLVVKDVCKVIEKLAPKEYKEAYDNVGLMVGIIENPVTSILVALDCTLEVIEEAKRKKCNLILTHHPLLFIKPSSITNETLQGTKIINLIKNDISLYSSHTNLDAVEGGINDYIVKLLGFEAAVYIEPLHTVSANGLNAGIGRLVTLSEAVTLSTLCDIVKEKLNVSNLRYIGEDNSQIKKIAIIGGSGSDYLKLSKSLGADCVITGDITYHYASDYNEMGLAIIDAGHFSSEWYAFKEFGKTLSNELISLGYNNSVIFSESIIDPYKTK